jgi:hypothetical protein
MRIKQDWSAEWATFFDEYAGEFHPSFKQKLAKQLFEKGSTGTGIRGFEKYEFQLLIGQHDLEMRQIGNNMFALVSFITPPAYSEPVWIYWTAEGFDVSGLHNQDVSNIDIDFRWGGNFPKEEILPYLKPYRRERKDKTGFHFDIEYYHNAFPDVTLEITFSNPPLQQQIETVNKSITDFAATWNEKNKDKRIEAVSSLIQKESTVFEVVIDWGVGNSIKTVGLLLNRLSENVQQNVISKMVVK